MNSRHMWLRQIDSRIYFTAIFNIGLVGGTIGTVITLGIYLFTAKGMIFSSLCGELTSVCIIGVCLFKIPRRASNVNKPKKWFLGRRPAFLFKQKPRI